MYYTGYVLIVQLLLFIVSFILILFGSGLIVSSVDRFSKRLRLSSFAVSFFLLGLLTSIPELALGLISVTTHKPEIFVGNLLGGIVVIFLFIIPLLAIFGNGISLNHSLDTKSLLITLGVILAPSFIILDRRATNLEGFVLICLFLFLFYYIERKKGIFDRKNSEILNVHAYSMKDIGKILFGLVLVFLSSQAIVTQTLYFSSMFHISPFYISLIMLSIGTNLPEISLAIRSARSGNKDVAFGDYLGSAAANTLLFGFFTILNDGEVITLNSFVTTFLFTIMALGLFFFLTRVRNRLTRKEGIVLMMLYGVFILWELIKS